MLREALHVFHFDVMSGLFTVVSVLEAFMFGLGSLPPF